MNTRSLAVFTTATCLAVAVILLPSPSRGQATDADKAKAAKAAAKAKDIARVLAEASRSLTLFDRQGKIVKTLPEKGLYTQPSLSPDGTRIVAIKQHLENETADVYVIDVETGASTRVTNNKSREAARAPFWSPDSKQVAYASQRDSYDGLYRRSANGEGPEELLYKATGFGLVLTDWSLDGKFLNFYTSQLDDNTLWALPLEGDRKPVVLAKSKSEIVAARLSPDSKYFAYRSNESGRNEIYLQAFNIANPGQAAEKVKISDNGGLGMVWWRRDGREMFYFAADRGIMSVEIQTSPTLEFGKPKLLFKAPTTIPNGPNSAPGNAGSVSRDGQRVIFSLPPEPRPQQLTIFDRTGKVVRKLGDPGQVGQPAYSRDGKMIAFMRNNIDAGNVNIWTMDLDSGATRQITNDNFPKNNPTWTPDGKHIAYQSNRGTYTSIYWRASDESGQEEMLFRYTPGAGLGLSDISPDGKYIVFDGGAIIMAVRLEGADPLARKAIEVSREEFEVGFGRFSPDGAFMSYGSNESNDRLEIFLRPFDLAAGTMPEQPKIQVTKEGVNGGNLWRADGKELFYAHVEPGSDEIQMMAVEITTKPELRAGSPKELFRIKDAGGGNTRFISPDGQNFIFAVLQPR
jgi:Tol biopolymer transport system component